jgi:Skp family chaperone for outer membrane proteins
MDMRIAAPLFVLVLCLAAAPPARAEGAIATVDMVRLLNDHPRLTEIVRKADQRQADAEAHAKTEGERLKKLEGEIELMNPTDPNQRAKQKELGAAMAALNFDMEWRKRDATREYLRAMESLYAEVQALVARHARERGIALVLNRNTEDLRTSSSEDFALKIRVRSVVHADPALDITDAVRKLLPAAGAPPAPPAGAGGTPPGPPPGSGPR